MDTFETAIAYVLQNEGGFIDDPNDSGGATNFGITIDTLARFRRAPCDLYAIKNLSDVEAKQIYKSFFWTPLLLDQIPVWAATAILDTAVNEGQVPAIKFAQQAAGFPGFDGLMGPKTVQRINVTERDEFIFDYVGHVQDHYVQCVKTKPSDIEFLGGWLKRSRRLYLLAHD